MNVEHIDLWAAHGDGGERGIGPICGYSRSHIGAEMLAAGRGFWGGNGITSKAHGLMVGDKIYVLADPHPVDIDGEQQKRDNQLKTDTINSLTDEQRRVLGF